jgi:hypothetical protein
MEDSVEIRNDTLAFGPFSGSGPRTAAMDVAFAGPVTKAAAILTGFVVEFSGGDDHHMGKLDIFLQTALKGGNLVGVTARFGLRDWSGNWDDKYDGRVNFAVVAE